MAYEFNPYRSVYRDPQTVKVAEVLRKRYVENFASDSMLDKGLNEMLVAAEFSGDVEKADELRAKLSQRANARTERGDFENLGMDINMDVRDFHKGYTPLQQNYQTREKDKEAKRQMIGKPGGITQQQYNDWEQRSALQTDEATGDYISYTGIQYDEDGILDRGSLYQPSAIASNINVDKEILTALQAIVAEEGGGFVRRDEESRDLDGDGTPDAVYSHQTQDGQWVRISPERVKAVTNQVLNRQDVQSFMEQDADFATYDMTEDELDAHLQSRISTLKGRIGAGQMTQEEEELAYREITALNRGLESGSTGFKRKLARDSHNAGRKESLTDMAIDARAVNNVTGGQDLWDYQRLLPVARTPGPTALPTVHGETEETISALLVDDQGNQLSEITVDSMQQVILRTEQDADDAATAIFDLYPGIAALIVGDPNLAQDSLLESLDHMSDTEMTAQIQKLHNDGRLVNEAGENVNPDVIKAQFSAAKRQREHYLALNEMHDQLFQTARSLTGAGDANNNIPSAIARPEDWNNIAEDWGTDTIDRQLDEIIQLHGGGQEGAIKSQEYMDMVVHTMLKQIGMENGVNHPLYGNIIEHVHQALGNERVSKERVEEVYESMANFNLNPDGDLALGSMDEYMYEDMSAAESIVALGGNFVSELEDGHEIVMGHVNELTQGNVTYPVSSRPQLAPKEVWDEFIEQVQATPMEALFARETMKGNTIADEINREADTAEITDIDVTWATDPKSGIPRPAFLLKIKAGEGQNKITKTVKMDPSKIIANDTTGIIAGFGLNTLDNQMIGLAYAAWNMAPGAVTKNNKITVPFNDGVHNDVQISFSINTEAGGVTIGGPVTLHGTILDANNQIREMNDVITFEQFQKSFHRLGVRMGLQADTAAEDARTAFEQSQNN